MLFVHFFTPHFTVASETASRGSPQPLVTRPVSSEVPVVQLVQCPWAACSVLNFKFNLNPRWQLGFTRLVCTGTANALARPPAYH